MTTIFKPQKKQEMFLSSSADIALYGGSAGGGKSHALLMEASRNINNPKYRCIFFRRTTTQITNPGGLFDKAKDMYLRIPFTKVKNDVLKFIFKSGAEIKMSHLEYDKDIYNHQGAEYCLMCFDELTHFTKRQFVYMLSRNRSTSGIKPYIRCSTNPDNDSWVRQFISWWIDEKTGLAIEERAGIIRYFTTVDGEFKWADSKKDLFKQYNDYGLSFTFIPAKLTDNKILMDSDPKYLSSLKALDPIEKGKLLDGNWNVSASNFGKILYRDYFRRFNNDAMPKFKYTYFVCDTATTIKTSSDYSIISYWGITKEGEYYIIDLHRVKLEAPEVEQLIIDLYNKYRKIQSIHGVFVERGMGNAIIQHLKRNKIPTFELVADKDKYTRLCSSLGKIQSRLVYVPENAEWVATFFQECENFRADMKHIPLDNEPIGHDDQVDVLAYGTSDQVDNLKRVVYSDAFLQGFSK